MKTERQLERRLEKTKMSPVAWILIIIFTGGMGIVLWLFLATVNYFEAKSLENKIDSLSERKLSRYEEAKIRMSA